MGTNYTLLIEKDGINKFRHTHDGLPLSKFSLSDYDCSIDGNQFIVLRKDGSKGFIYQIVNITIKDNTASGTPENYTDPLVFEDRLRALGYTPYLLTPGAVEEAPADGQIYGRKDGNWVVLGSGGGNTPHNNKVVYAGAAITVPTGFSGIVTNLNDINAVVTFSVTGTNLTITGGANNDEVLLINGKY